MKQLYVIVHQHRFGTTVHPVYADELPSESVVMFYLDEAFEPNRDDESFEVLGPYADSETPYLQEDNE